MHPGNRHFHDVSSPFGSVFAATLPPTPESFPADLALTDDAQDALLNDALAIGHTGTIAAALGLIARTRGMSRLAAETGIRRQQLYRALGPDGNPTLDTLTRVVSALGYRLSAERDQGRGAAPTPC